MIPVQYIISAESCKSAISHAKTALSSGCKWIQLETNDLERSKAEKASKEIKKLCRDNNAAFVIENDIELVKAVEADGIHLTNGMTVAEARQILGEGFLIGTNVSTAEDIILNKKLSADYLCCGPFDKTKSEFADSLDLTTYSKILEEVEDKGITLPLAAFGNINPEDTTSLLRTGIRGIVVQIHGEKIKEDTIRKTLESYLNA